MKTLILNKLSLINYKNFDSESFESIEAAWQAGADLVVIGSIIENKPEDLNWLPNPAAFQSRGLADTWS